MASVLSNNMSDLKAVTFFMEECRRIDVPVLGPSVNESLLRFSVNNEGAVRFGMGGMKGVGENAVREIISKREEGGQFKDLFDLLERIDLRQANRKTIECLILGGAMDDFPNTHRAMYFSEEEEAAVLWRRPSNTYRTRKTMQRALRPLYSAKDRRGASTTKDARGHRMADHRRLEKGKRDQWDVPQFPSFGRLQN